jgi:sarcosine oxidase subunit gamma
VTVSAPQVPAANVSAPSSTTPNTTAVSAAASNATAPNVAALRRSPLSDLAADFEAATVTGPRAVRLREIPFLAQVNLRADPANGYVMRRIAAALDEELPTRPNTVATAGIRHVLWLGPDEWLVIGPDGDAHWIERALRSALGEKDADGFGSVVNVSAGRTVLELSGPAAREVLEKGCALDLHPDVFRPGHCAQTLVSRSEVILHQTADTPTPTYRLLVRMSFARYLALWLMDAMQEFRHGTLEEHGLEGLG